MSTVAAGQILAGKYRVERVLGEGGMGVVVAAWHVHLDKRVALKFLRPEMTTSRDLVARFANEARSSGKIQSEHVAKVLDVGMLDDGAPYMVMEYLEGTDLSGLIRSRGAVPGPDAVEYILQACEALAEAHVAGIVHRDLKPANLFLTHRADGSPSIKVLDFGISKAALSGDVGQALTQTSAVLGSPSYMAPEQLKSSRNVDARTDIWALGILLHELVTGDVAFRADTVPELYVSILQGNPPPLRSILPGAPASLEATILRCLEKDPARRFANVGELALALSELAPPRARPSVERITKIVGVAGPAARPSVPQPPQALYGGGVAATMNNPGVPPTQVGPHGMSYASAPAPTVPQHLHHQPTPQPQQGYGPPQQPHPQHPQHRAQSGYGMAAPPGYGPYPPQQAYAQGPPPKQGMPPATIALIIIVALVVFGVGGCFLCVCVSAAASGAEHASLDGAALERVLLEGAAGGPASTDPRASSPLPFQRPAGWTRFAAGEILRLGPGLAFRPLEPSRSRGKARAAGLPREERFA